MTNTPGRAWFERQLAYLVAMNVDGLVGQYHDDANLLFDIKGQIQGRDAIREFFVEHLAWLGRVELKSIDAFTETGNSCFAEVRLLTAAGEGRVVDTFVLREDKARLHFNGVVSFTPFARQDQERPMSNAATIQRMYEYYGQGKLEAAQGEIFANDVRWHLPGHHPLAGTKQGLVELIAYFAELRRLGVKLDPIKIADLDDALVGDVHREHGESSGAKLDTVNIAHYKMKDGRIYEVQLFLNNQYGADNFYSAVCQLKGIPGRFANQ
jgi:uncharacterized protein